MQTMLRKGERKTKLIWIFPRRSNFADSSAKLQKKYLNHKKFRYFFHFQTRMKGFSIALSVVISGSFVGDTGALGAVVAGVTTPNDVGGDDVVVLAKGTSYLTVGSDGTKVLSDAVCIELCTKRPRAFRTTSPQQLTVLIEPDVGHLTISAKGVITTRHGAFQRGLDVQAGLVYIGCGDKTRLYKSY